MEFHENLLVVVYTNNKEAWGILHYRC